MHTSAGNNEGTVVRVLKYCFLFNIIPIIESNVYIMTYIVAGSVFDRVHLWYLRPADLANNIGHGPANSYTALTSTKWLVTQFCAKMNIFSNTYYVNYSFCVISCIIKCWSTA